jgi:hypothetical protein
MSGSSIAGMPSRGTPPDMISDRSTVSRKNRCWARPGPNVRDVGPWPWTRRTTGRRRQGRHAHGRSSESGHCMVPSECASPPPQGSPAHAMCRNVRLSPRSTPERRRRRCQRLLAFGLGLSLIGQRHRIAFQHAHRNHAVRLPDHGTVAPAPALDRVDHVHALHHRARQRCTGRSGAAPVRT